MAFHSVFRFLAVGSLPCRGSQPSIDDKNFYSKLQWFLVHHRFYPPIADSGVALSGARDSEAGQIYPSRWVSIGPERRPVALASVKFCCFTRMGLQAGPPTGWANLSAGGVCTARVDRPPETVLRPAEISAPQG
jgi:hypothetical protein